MSLSKYLIEAISLSDTDLRQYILNSTPNVKSEKLKRIYSIIKSSDPEEVEGDITTWFENHGIRQKDIIEDILYRFEKYEDLIEFIRYIDPENHHRKTLKEAFPNTNTTGTIPDIFTNLKDKDENPITFSDKTLKSIATYNQAGGIKVGHYEYLLRIMSDDATVENANGKKNGDIFGNGVAIELKASSKNKSQSDPRCKSHDFPSNKTITMFRDTLNKHISNWGDEDSNLNKIINGITKDDIYIKYKSFEEGEVFWRMDTLAKAIENMYNQLGEKAGDRVPRALADAFCVYWGNENTEDKNTIFNFLKKHLSPNNLEVSYINALFGAINLYLYQKEEKFTNIVIVDPNMNYINIAKFDLDSLFELFKNKTIAVTKMPNEKSKSAYDCAACIRYNK